MPLLARPAVKGAQPTVARGDVSNEVIQDDQLARLMTFPNVIITGHQAFFTEDALTKIAETTLANVSDLEAGRTCPNVVTP